MLLAVTVSCGLVVSLTNADGVLELDALGE